MLLIIGLLISLLLTFGCSKLIKKNPVVFYILSAALSIAATLTAEFSLSLPDFFNNYILALFTKSIIAAALWIIVMWTGALKNGSFLIKKLMPVRGELSIIAFILTLCHVIVYGQIYLTRLIFHYDTMQLPTLLMTVLSVLMVVIMLPLSIISFKKIRKKINPKAWKKVQKFAYLFYALIYIHILMLDIPKAQSGNKEYIFNVMAYSIIFVSYAICRIRKYLLIRKKIQKKVLLNTVLSVIGAVSVCGIAFCIRPIPHNVVEARPEKIAAASEYVTELSSVKKASSVITTQPPTQITTVLTTESFTEKTTKKLYKKAAVSATQAPAKAPVQQSEQITASPTQSIYYQTNENPVVTETPQENNYVPVQQEMPQTIPVPATETFAPTEPEKIYIYNDGTYTATAFGYDGDITVTVTVKNDIITDIKGTTAESDDYYFSMAKKDVFRQILDRQQPNVDACSGATYSSKAIMQAVQKALDSAKKQ